MFSFLYDKFSYDLGIDLGTSNTIVFAVGKGVIINEPTVVAINKKTKDVLAIGTEAKRMYGKTPDSISVIRPLKNGVVSDFDIAQKILLYFLRKSQQYYRNKINLFGPRVLIGVPSGITEVERRAVADAAKSAGARVAHLIEEPLASAVGAGLDVTEPNGNMLIDIGGGTTEIAVISMGGLVIGKSIKTAGDEFDTHIIDFAKENLNILLGEKSAEDCKIAIGNVLEDDEAKKLVFQIRGRDLKSGLPKTVDITGLELKKAIRVPISTIISCIKDAVEETPPELVPDIIKRGVVLSGGGSLLKGLDKLISKEISIKASVASEPLFCMAKGCAKVLGEAKLFSSVRRLA